MVLIAACDRGSSDRPGQPAAKDSTDTEGQARTELGGENGNNLSNYDLMLSRYRTDRDSATWCYSGEETNSKQRVVEVQRDYADPLPLLPLSVSSGRDSASVAAELTRLVAALPSDSASPLFGVPFSIRHAVLGTDPTTQQAPRYLVAVVVRRLPQEDQPLEEQFSVIAQQSDAPANAAWELAWHERTQGTEDQLSVTDPFLVLRVRSTGRVVVVLMKESAAGARLVFVEQGDRGDWRVQWERGVTPCVAPR